MIEYQIYLPKKKKLPKIHKLRDCRDCLGELGQMDGSYHAWFEKRAPECCLLVIIDDATSRLMWLQFVEWESTLSYFEMLDKYIKKWGVPLAIYTDRHAIFETTRNTEKDYKDTQFHRAMTELGIELILALSPQAKGRVERANGILQDRLVKEMRLAGISSMEEGNEFLPSYLEKHNLKFAKEPKSPMDAHRALDIDHNTDRILCLHFERTISKDLMVCWRGKTYQISETNNTFRLGGKKVKVYERSNGFDLIYQGKKLNYINFERKHYSPKVTLKELEKNWPKKNGTYAHKKEHPWRKCI